MPAADESIYALDFSFWKRPYVRLFFQGQRVCFVTSGNKVPAGVSVSRRALSLHALA